jgi:Ca2+-binding EF-hand superfamily protein
LKCKGKFSEETTLLKAFKFTDLSDSGFVNPECFLRALTKLGVNLVNRENLLEYFNFYDKDRTGRINYRDFITELFVPHEMKRRKMMEEEPKSEGGEMPTVPKKEKRKYNLTSSGFRQKIEQNLDKNIKLIKKIKKEIMNQDANTLFDIEKTIMKFDVDNSTKIDMDEFSRLFYEFNINLTPDEIKIVFSCFDPSRTGKLYYEDFLNIIREPLNELRADLVDQLYNSLKKNNRGNLEIKTFFGAFSDKKVDPEFSEEFKDNFLSHHDFFSKGKTEVGYDEFISFFEIISINYKEDPQFEEFMTNSFNLENAEEQKPTENVENEENIENQEEKKEFFEALGKLREILEKKGASGVIEFLRNLRNVDLAHSNGIDLDEFITVIQSIIKDSDNTFPVKEIQNIFNVYDINQNGIMEYKKFLDDLLKLRAMPKSRKNHIQKIFNHLDFEGKQALDINELINLYKKPPENDPVPDLLDSFITFHNILRGNRNPLVTINDFLKFYNYINFLIPESKNDKIFMDFTSETWLLYDKSFDERKNLMKVKIEGLGKQKNRDAKNKLIVSHKTPYGTIKDKINYNLNEGNATMKYNVNKIEDLMGHLRSILAQRGYSGIMSIRRTFMIIDENSNKKITFDEFEKLFKKYRYDLSEEEINNLFNYFDKDGSGFIDYDEFVNGICGNLNKFRKDVLKQVFEKLDENERGYVTVGQLRNEYNPKEHPLVRQGKRTEEEILAEFLDVLEYHFNLLIEKSDDNLDVNEIKVDFDDFCEFYKNISVCIEDDKYFEVMVLSEWGIKKDGKSLYQRTWNQQDA